MMVDLVRLDMEAKAKTPAPTFWRCRTYRGWGGYGIFVFTPSLCASCCRWSCIAGSIHIGSQWWTCVWLAQCLRTEKCSGDIWYLPH